MQSDVLQKSSPVCVLFGSLPFKVIEVFLPVHRESVPVRFNIWILFPLTHVLRLNSVLPLETNLAFPSTELREADAEETLGTRLCEPGVLPRAASCKRRGHSAV